MYKSIALAIIVLAASSSRAPASTPTISVSGSIDASNVMHINPASVSWTRNTGVGPTALTVNGTPWNPTAQPTLSLPPGPLIPSPLSDYFVHTAVSAGRELANAQIVGSEVQLFFDDTNNGPDNYAATVSFTPKPPPTLTPSATLHITADIDGSDTLRITNTNATWIHNAWDPPSNVKLNGIPWNTVTTPTLANSGSTTFLPPGVDLSTVAFTKTTGRDTSTYQLFSDHLDVYFADDFLGAGPYDDTLSFGSVPEPTMLAPLAFATMMFVRAARRGPRQER
jgi:hypothetical protein